MFPTEYLSQIETFKGLLLYVQHSTKTRQLYLVLCKKKSEA